MHSCPECGQACYCSGDIEDHDTGQEYEERCTCCLYREDEDIDSDEWTCEDRSEPERLVMNCGYPGCVMPGEHFPSECHNAEDIENQMRTEPPKPKDAPCMPETEPLP